MRFTKMHGLGNDYVYIDGTKETVADPSELARNIADRHFGVGGDGMILILKSDTADVRMRMFNADGSEGEMCGNGVRCVAKYAFDHGLSSANPIKVETGRGVLSIALQLDSTQKVATATVDMDEPMLELDAIPVKQGTLGRNPYFSKQGDHEYALAMEVDGRVVRATFVSMGNPHLVWFVDDVDAIKLDEVGPKLEHYPAFPKRINVHVAQVVSPTHIKMRTWERGSGITLACGTGACAVAVAGALVKNTRRQVTVTLPGGDLKIDWQANNRVLMTGPATEVFTGEFPSK
jgi:diaminopimelate epimerase